MANLIDIGLTGLQASQTALNVTGNNVTNANTEGYSRQRAEQVAARSQFIGSGYLGSGVMVTDINRMTNQFAVNQVRTDTSMTSEVDKFLSYIEQIDGLLADPATGLAPAMNNFFGSLQSAGDDPSSIPERQLVLTESEALINRFEVILARFDTLSSSVDQDMRSQVSSMNGLANGIAQINRAIASSVGQTAGKDPNDLLDQRDELIRQLAEVVNVTAIPREDGQTDILIGKGQALVVGSVVNEAVLQASDADPNRLDIALLENGIANNVTGEISGGELGGLLQFRVDSLQTAYNALGRIALTLADTVNTQHQLGMDLEDDLGGLFFTDINELETQFRRVIPNEQNATPKDRVVGLEIVDVTQLTTDEYTLSIRGPSVNDVIVENALTGELVTTATLPGVFPAEIEFAGLRVNMQSGSFQVGDQFLLTPTREGGRNLELSTVRVEDIALASPVRTEADLGNIGNARISQGEMLAVRAVTNNDILPTWQEPGEMTPPILIRFITDDYYQVLDNSNPAAPASLNPPLDNQRYIPGVANPVFSSDPGQTALVSEGASIGQINSGPGANGYGAQTITVQTRDPATGLLVSNHAVDIAPNASAATAAAQLSAVNGISASAFTEVRLSNFTDNGSGISPSLRITVEEFDIAGNSVLVPVDLGTALNPNDLADAINANSQLQDHDIVAWSDGNALTVRNLVGEDIIIDLAGDSGVGGDSVDIETDFVSSVTTLAGGSAATIGGQIDLRMDNGVAIRANNSAVFDANQTPVSSFLGYQVDLSGTPKIGDQFSIEYNSGGVSDSRNGLALIGLESMGLVDGGVSSFSEAYAQMVETTGSVTSQAQLDSEASLALLRQSEGRLQELAGVNLDEEAGRLIQFQSSYNASARVVAIARELFTTLLSTFG